MRDKYADQIRERFVNIPRRVSGFNLQYLLPENGFHVARALVGTESTCITILEATLNLIPNPKHRTLLILGYEDIFSAGDNVPEIMEHRPIACEGLDDVLIQLMKKKHLQPHEVELLPKGNGWLLIEFGGETEDEAKENNTEAHERLKAKIKDLMKHQRKCEVHGNRCHVGVFAANIYVSQKIPIAGVAHQNGTMRFGSDPQTSFLDLNCRTHDVKNLYVVDGSFFPSCSAVNPGLTIMANALRVGEYLIAEMG